MTDKYTIEDIKKYSVHGDFLIYIEKALELINQAYEEGRIDFCDNNGYVYQPGKQIIEFNIELKVERDRLIIENEKHKKENELLMEKLADWENHGQRIIYSPSETKQIVEDLQNKVNSLIKENEELKELNKKFKSKLQMLKSGLNEFSGYIYHADLDNTDLS